MSVMITYTNRLVDIIDLANSDPLSIKDIAHSLSNKCRFNGHCRKFYSVAEHSICCSILAPGYLKLSALLHDATEAYLGDITGPIKRHFGNIFYPIEDSIEQMIRNTFSLPMLTLEDRKMIEHIDKIMLLREARHLFDNPYSDERFIWPNSEVDDLEQIPIRCFSPEVVEQSFLAKYRILTQ